MLCCALACLAAGPGCGGKAARGRTTPRETADTPAPLPPGWRQIVDARGGFTVGLPPGWTSKLESAATRARSRDGTAALSVFADRSRDGRDDAPEEYLRRTVTHLTGYRRLRPGSARPAKGLFYPAATITASGVYALTGIRQQIQLYALRRPGLVTYTVSVFRTAGASAARYTEVLDTIVRSLRASAPQF